MTHYSSNCFLIKEKVKRLLDTAQTNVEEWE
jgi:hypothetical protein